MHLSKSMHVARKRQLDTFYYCKAWMIINGFRNVMETKTVCFWTGVWIRNINEIKRLYCSIVVNMELAINVVKERMFPSFGTETILFVVKSYQGCSKNEVGCRTMVASSSFQDVQRRALHISITGSTRSPTCMPVTLLCQVGEIVKDKNWYLKLLFTTTSA